MQKNPSGVELKKIYSRIDNCRSDVCIIFGVPNIIQTSLEYVNSTTTQSCVVINVSDIDRNDILESIEILSNYIKKITKNKARKKH